MVPRTNPPPQDHRPLTGNEKKPPLRRDPLGERSARHGKSLDVRMPDDGMGHDFFQ